VSVTDYRDQGYLPDGVLNYLARLGWSHGDQELFTRQELIEKFNWEHVGQTGARFDVKKLQSVQAHHLRQLSAAELAAASQPFLAKRGLDVAKDDPKLIAAAPLVAPRATTFVDAADALDYFFRQPPEIDAKAKAKFLTGAQGARCQELANVIEPVTPWAAEPLEQAVKHWLDGAGIELKEVAQPARVALTGRSASPGLFDVLEVLGREWSLARLRAVG
jgi:glutamyl-tRNA synthetase